ADLVGGDDARAPGRTGRRRRNRCGRRARPGGANVAHPRPRWQCRDADVRQGDRRRDRLNRAGRGGITEKRSGYVIAGLTAYVKIHIIGHGPTQRRAKALVWRGSSKRDFMAFPRGAQREMGYALFLAQMGERHPKMTKMLKGFGGGAIIEVMLHAFQ